MTPSAPDFPSLPIRSAVASVAYRARRWQAARVVLRNRVIKQRIPGPLGEALQEWGVGQTPPLENESLQLTFGLLGTQLWWCDGLASLPLERALLHLPALRGFWRQELRQKHFDALKTIVPQAWLKDKSEVPPGAVIHGLGIPAWGDLPRLRDRIPPVAADGPFVAEQPVPETTIHAFYQQDGQGRVVLRSIEALP